MTEQLDSKEADRQLVLRVQKGDKHAFDMLVLKYQHRILALISRFVSDSHEVQDIAQEAFVKAYRALPSFRGQSAFYTWLYRIAINTAKNHLVARSRRPPGNDLDIDQAQFLSGAGKLSDLESPENALLRDELENLIFTTIRELPADLRTAISLREFDGLSYDEIAEIMECPVGTVRSRIFRARETIDEKIKGMVEQTAADSPCYEWSNQIAAR